MERIGDITTVSVYAIAPVDVVTGGSAYKRACKAGENLKGRYHYCGSGKWKES